MKLTPGQFRRLASAQEYLSVGLDAQGDVEQGRGAAGPVMDGQDVVADVECDAAADEGCFLQQKGGCWCHAQWIAH